MIFKSLVNPQNVAAFSATMKLERVGKISVTVASGLQSATGAVTLSPALPDATLTNYVVSAVINDSVITGSSVITRLISTTSLGFRVFRNLNQMDTQTPAITVTPGDLTDVLVLPTDPGGGADPHGADSGFGPHGHTTTGHPASQVGHTHALVLTGAFTQNVDWMIIHI